MDKGDDVAAAAAVVAAVGAAAAEAEAVEPAEAAEGMEDVEDEHGAASDGGVRAAEAAEVASASVAACSLLGAGGSAWAAYEIAREALVGGWPASALAVLTALPRYKPLMIVVEDTEQIDAMSLELFDELAKQLGSLKLFLCMCWRYDSPGCRRALASSTGWRTRWAARTCTWRRGPRLRPRRWPRPSPRARRYPRR